MHLIVQLVSISLKGIKFLAKFYLSGLGILLAFSAAVMYFIWQCLYYITNYSDIPSLQFLEPLRDFVNFVSSTIQSNDVASLFFYAIAGDVAVDSFISGLLFMANVFLGGFAITFVNLLLISCPAILAKVMSYVPGKQFKP